MEKTVVVGATGDVGRGIVARLLGMGRPVVAVSRSSDALDDLARELDAGSALTACIGDVSDAESARTLAHRLTTDGGIRDVVVSVNGPARPRSLPEIDSKYLTDVFAQNVLPHFEAAKALIPAMRPGTTYLAIGGGMADFIVPGMAAVSIAQAAQRNLFRFLHAETLKPEVRVVELMLFSMISSKRTVGIAKPDWITADEVGSHVGAVLADATAFPGPILRLRSRAQVGKPETALIV